MPGLLYLLALIPLVLSQVEDDDLPVGLGDDGGDCIDKYSNCDVISVNNWCNEKHYRGKCCRSCKEYEESKDPDCHDVGTGCVLYKRVKCSSRNNYRDGCKKTCGLCT